MISSNFAGKVTAFMSDKRKVRDIEDSNVLRFRIAEMIYSGGEGHIPSSFSILDIVRSIYSTYSDLGLPSSKTKFILSKGHGSAALYVVLNSCGLLPDEYITNYGKPGSKLGGHPERLKVQAIEASTGSLGHGFPFAVGLALSVKIMTHNFERVVVLLGDGECQEGTIWEAAAIASNQKLGNLLAFVDWNGSAAQLQSIENLEMKWGSFGWRTVTIDGHNSVELLEFLQSHDFSTTIPTVVLAKTTKGKGVKFLEGHGVWHHKMPSPEQLGQIRLELSQ